MPLYMDRHDVSPTVTAENVAELHHQDLKIQHLYNCRGLTYWFDENRGTAFCLVDAPDVKSLQEMHANAHGEVPNQIIEVESSIVESFLGRIEDPAKSQNTELNIINDPAFRTIMVVKLYRNELRDNQSILPDSSIGKWKNNIGELIPRSEGNIVKQADNYFLISFKSVSKAINCSLEIRSSFQNLFDKMEEKDFNLKIGVSAGVPVTEKESFFEDAIKLAQRFCEVNNDKIIISSEVKDSYNSENANELNKTENNFFNFLPADEKLFTQLMNFMESSYGNAYLTVHDFTNSLGLSKSKLYRKIRLLTGKSLNPFIREYRLNKAMDLLHKNLFSLSELRTRLGLPACRTFPNVFRSNMDKFLLH